MQYTNSGWITVLPGAISSSLDWMDERKGTNTPSGLGLGLVPRVTVKIPFEGTVFYCGLDSHLKSTWGRDRNTWIWEEFQALSHLIDFFLWFNNAHGFSMMWMDMGCHGVWFGRVQDPSLRWDFHLQDWFPVVSSECDLRRQPGARPWQKDNEHGGSGPNFFSTLGNLAWFNTRNTRKSRARVKWFIPCSSHSAVLPCLKQCIPPKLFGYDHGCPECTLKSWKLPGARLILK